MRDEATAGSVAATVRPAVMAALAVRVVRKARGPAVRVPPAPVDRAEIAVRDVTDAPAARGRICNGIPARAAPVEMIADVADVVPNSGRSR